jgi:hypothetical protein
MFAAVHMGPVHRLIRIRRVVFRHGASRDVSTSVHRCKALIVIRFDGPGEAWFKPEAARVTLWAVISRPRVHGKLLVDYDLRPKRRPLFWAKCYPGLNQAGQDVGVMVINGVLTCNFI